MGALGFILEVLGDMWAHSESLGGGKMAKVDVTRGPLGGLRAHLGSLGAHVGGLGGAFGLICFGALGLLFGGLGIIILSLDRKV